MNVHFTLTPSGILEIRTAAAGILITEIHPLEQLELIAVLTRGHLELIKAAQNPGPAPITTPLIRPV